MLPDTNFTRQPTSDFYDPDAGLDPKLREKACSYSLFLFNRLRLTPCHVCDKATGNDLPGFIYVEAGGAAQLVFVRVTVEGEMETGTGPLPGILIDQAREYNARPHVLRVHFRLCEEGGVGTEYFGHDELEREWKQTEWWRRKLLHGRTARDCLRLAGGQPFHLEVQVKYDQPGIRTPNPDPKLTEMFKENSTEPYFFGGAVELALKVTPDPRTPTNRGCIWVSALLASTYRNDELYIFNCDCGSPECAGILAGVDVVNEDGLVVWRMRGNNPCRLLVFDCEQYRREIITQVRAALAWAKETGPKTLFVGASDIKWVEAALYRAEEGF